jgi:hypothetical protein
MTGGEACSGIRMEHSRMRNPSVSQSKGTRPGDRAFLAAAAKGMPPVHKHPMPEHPRHGNLLTVESAKKKNFRWADLVQGT